MATIPTYPTLGVGHILTNSDMTGIKTYNDFFKNGSGGLAFLAQGTIQSIPTASDTPLTWDIETLDVDNGHSLVTNTARYTAQTPGWYDIEGVVNFSATGSGYRIGKVRVNGSTVVGQTCLSAIAVVVGVPVVARTYLTAGQYVEICARQNDAGAINTALSDGSSFMRVRNVLPG